MGINTAGSIVVNAGKDWILVERHLPPSHEDGGMGACVATLTANLGRPAIVTRTDSMARLGHCPAVWSADKDDVLSHMDDVWGPAHAAGIGAWPSPAIVWTVQDGAATKEVPLGVFIANNKELLARIGALALLEQQGYDAEALLGYIAIWATYPCVEQVVKMGRGYAFLVNDALSEAAEATDTASATAVIRRLGALLRNAETAGAKILRLPRCVQEYLAEGLASFRVWEAWKRIVDVWPITQKQELLEIVQDPAFEKNADLEVLGAMPGLLVDKEVPGGLRRSPQHLANFLAKQAVDFGQDGFKGALRALGKYERLCDLLDYRPDAYPPRLAQAISGLERLWEERKALVADLDLAFSDAARNAMAVLKVAEAGEVPALVKVALSRYELMVPCSVRDMRPDARAARQSAMYWAMETARGSGFPIFVRRRSDPDVPFARCASPRGGGVPMVAPWFMGFGDDFDTVHALMEWASWKIAPCYEAAPWPNLGREN